MSIQAMSWVINLDLPAADGKFVLLMLANHADEDGYCYPSQKRLAQECGLGERAVRNQLSRLEDIGLIRRQRRTRQNGSRTSDGYWLVGIGQPAKSAGMSQDVSNRQINHSQPAKSAAPEPSVNPQRELDTPTVVSSSPGDEKKPAKSRKRNETWDALAAICGEPAGKTEASDFGKTVSELREIEATVTEIADFPRWWHATFNGATLTHRCYRAHFGKYRNSRDKPLDINSIRDPFMRALIRQGVSSNGRGTDDTHTQARRIGRQPAEAQSLGPGVRPDGRNLREDACAM